MNMMSLHRNRVLLRTETIVALEGDEGILHRIRFDSGEALERRALFIDWRVASVRPTRTIGL